MCWCNLAGIQLLVQKTAALPTSRSQEGWEEKGHLGFPRFFYLPSPAELQQPHVRPAHMVSLRGCLCHLLLLPRPSSIPTQPGRPQSYPMYPERLSSMRISSFPAAIFVPPITGGRGDTWVLWTEGLRKEGPLKNNSSFP